MSWSWILALNKKEKKKVTSIIHRQLQVNPKQICATVTIVRIPILFWIITTKKKSNGMCMRKTTPLLYFNNLWRTRTVRTGCWKFDGAVHQLRSFHQIMTSSQVVQITEVVIWSVICALTKWAMPPASTICKSNSTTHVCLAPSTPNWTIRSMIS